MTCVICSELLFSRREQQRGVCAPCYLRSLRDGRRWSAERSGCTPKPAAAGEEAEESIAPRTADRDTGQGMP
jgi:hypothetical protein